jgi:cytochrome c-type biogenesis protein
VPRLNYEKHIAKTSAKTTGYARSFANGAAFSVSWTACVGPILGSILTIAATRETAWQGAYLLGVYSLGLGLPFLAIGAAFDFLTPVLKRINKYSGIIRIASGLLLIAIGILILTGNLTWFSQLAA